MSSKAEKDIISNHVWAQIILSVLGIPPNFISFIYFLLKEERTLPNVLTIGLAITDFVFLVASFARYQCYLTYDLNTQTCLYLSPVVVAGNYLSALLTCVLTVTRAIAISKPLYNISKNVVYTIVLVLSVYKALQGIPFYRRRQKDAPEILVIKTLGLFQVVTEILLILAGSVSIIYHIYRTPVAASASAQESRQKNNRKVTITILAISIIFVVTNGCGFVSVLLEKESDLTKLVKGYFFVLNSCLNPVVYIVRLKKLRVFVKQLFRRNIVPAQVDGGAA